MLSLILAAYINTQSAQSVSVQVSECMERNAYSCNDREARENDGLLSCFMLIPHDVEAIRADFEQKMRIICPIEPSIKRKIVKSWNY